MTFIELVEAVAAEVNMPKSAVKTVLKSFSEKTAKTALSGEAVMLPGFGKFSQRIVKPRKAFGKETQGRTSIKFKPYV